jgi:hypothetical protein
MQSIPEDFGKKNLKKKTLQVAHPDVLKKTAQQREKEFVRHPTRGTLQKTFGNRSECVKFFTSGVDAESSNGRYADVC